MGTNFYWILKGATDERRALAPTTPTGNRVAIDSDDPTIHIGKRSAAGMYCWDCRQTLCRGGVNRIHHGGKFADSCLECGAPPTREGISSSSPVAVELGFGNPRTDRPTGVRGCSSFSWAQHPNEVCAECNRRDDEVIIEDEYGRTMTGGQFLRMLAANCPIWFTNLLGRRFC